MTKSLERKVDFTFKKAMTSLNSMKKTDTNLFILSKLFSFVTISSLCKNSSFKASNKHANYDFKSLQVSFQPANALY